MEQYTRLAYLSEYVGKQQLDHSTIIVSQYQWPVIALSRIITMGH